MCGMTRSNDILHAVSLGVDAIGLIFYQQSARALTVGEAALLLHDLPPFVDAVAVFVNPEVSFVEHVMAELPIQCLQFHGDESPAFCEYFRRPYMKAVPAISSEAIINTAEQYQHAAGILLETPSTTCHGGTGLTFDWTIIPPLVAKPIILAGGLNALNVRAAVGTCSPYAVDVCSGIESAPGIKDHDKMSQFVNELWGRG